MHDEENERIYEENERIFTRFLGIFVFIIYLFIAICCLFIIAVSRVDAKENISLSQCWLGSNTGCNKTFDLSNMQGDSVAIDINNVPSGTLSFHTTLTMNLWNWQSGDSVNVGGGYVVDNTFYSCDSGNSNGCYMKCPVTGTWANCEMWIDTFIAQNDVKVTSLYYLNGNTFNRTFNAIASGSATIDKSTGNLTNGSFNTAIDNQTNTIINNQDKNTQDIIDSIQGGSLKDNTQPDNSKLNDYDSAEKNLIDRDKLNNIDNLEVAIDSKSNTYVWDVTTRFIQSHPKIFAMVITMLSVGIIKLILNR